MQVESPKVAGYNGCQQIILPSREMGAGLKSLRFRATVLGRGAHSFLGRALMHPACFNCADPLHCVVLQVTAKDGENVVVTETRVRIPWSQVCYQPSGW
jgi:hypothetical protein